MPKSKTEHRISSDKVRKNGENQSKNPVEENVVILGEEFPKDSRSYGGAIFFIALGIVLLMNTTGLIPWSAWLSIWRFWPILVIYSGLKLLFADSKWGKLFIGLLAVVTLLLGLSTMLVVFAFDRIQTTGFNIPTWLEHTSRRVWNYEGETISDTFSITTDDYNVADIDKRVFDIKVGYGELKLKDENTSGHLSGSFDYPEYFGVPEISEDLDEKTLNLDFDAQTNSKSFTFSSAKPVYDLLVGYDWILTDLYLDLGAGNGDVKLLNQNIGEFYTNVGAGDLSIEFGRLPENMELNVGAGSMRVVVPTNAGIKVDYNVGVGSLRILGYSVSGLGKEGIYESDNYATAENKVRIRADVGVGELTIVNK